ncbi:hypothetical protein [Neobacillus sp. LXY-4]|uniref:hypothetical protein n=1 Tax=Neobacillus sp. LXY-4 TaxID=3379826 RepID=UPI003EE14336
MLTSILYTLLIGIPLLYVLILLYDFLFGEKREKQIRKIEKRFADRDIIKIDVLDHQPGKFTLFQVKTKSGTEKFKLKPGYKYVKIVPKKK